MELDKIPGYQAAMAAAQAEEAALRDVPFMEAPLEICGVAVHQLTPAHLLVLFNSGNPFFKATTAIEPEHVVQLLWIISIDFVAGDFTARDAFTARIAELDFAAVVAGIEGYLEEAFMDAPPSGGARRDPITSFVATLVDQFAAEYGWTRREILQTPIAALYQLMRRIERRRNDKATFFNRLGDRTRRRLVKEWKAAQKAEGGQST